MKLGMIGLGKMGANMAERLRRHGHVVVGMDPAKPEADAHTLQELVPLLEAEGQPRVAWSMVPAGPITDGVIRELATRLSPGDVVVSSGQLKLQNGSPVTVTADAPPLPAKMPVE